MVRMTPPGSIRRIRWLPLSVNRMAPSGNTSRSYGQVMRAAVAGPPSPLKPVTPVPATVVISPSLATRRMR